MTEDPNRRRRSRRRATARQGPPAVAPPVPPEPAVPPTPVEPPAPTDRDSRPRRENRGDPRNGPPGAKGARGDRDLAGSGSSQVGPTGAMRARDVNRPTPADLAEAEAHLEIVRRHWAPTPDAVEPRTPRRRRS